MKATIAALVVLVVVVAHPAHALRAGPFPLAAIAEPGRRLLQLGHGGHSTVNNMIAANNAAAAIQMAVDSDSPAMATEYAARSAVGDTMLATMGGPYALYGLTAPRPIIN